jgi:hypothetical protein
MPRRPFIKTPKGQLYAVEWPEWFAECTHPDCDQTLQIAELGTCMTLTEAKQAGKKLLDTNQANGWVCKKGQWYCPCHKGES